MGSSLTFDIKLSLKLFFLYLHRDIAAKGYAGFSYNHQNRMSSASVNGLNASYGCGTLGQRVFKNNVQARNTD